MKRCIICGWTLAKDQAGGCVPGDCSYRPDEPREQDKLRRRRKLVANATLATQRAWEAQGTIPFPLYETEARAIACEVIEAYEAERLVNAQ